MKVLPATDNPLVFRTDFSNRKAWESICATIKEPVGEFHANVDFLDEVQCSGLTKDQLLALVRENYGQSFIIVADREAISFPHYPLLIVQLHEGDGQEFRAIPSQVQAIENNLSIANMGFEEFAEAIDSSGVFRGFQKIIKE
jgi:hypothetical protein